MRFIVAAIFTLWMSFSSGCSMCSRGYLDDYATVGGKWQRSDPVQGRVGSIFSDAGATVAASHDEAMNSQSPYIDSYEGEFDRVESYEADGNEFLELQQDEFGDWGAGL